MQTIKSPLDKSSPYWCHFTVNIKSKQHDSPKIFISACEASGDKHAADLVREILQQLPTARISGVGGPKMDAAGCTLLKNTVDKSAMGLAIFGKLGIFLALLNFIKDELETQKPDLIIVVDSFAFNSHVAKRGKKIGIPVLYYIAPQLWAWAPWRIKKLKRSATRVASIFPFESQWYADRGFSADFVGNPLFDHKPKDLTPPFAPNDASPKIALLPGSRQQEIDKLWVPMQSIALNILGQFPNARFYTAAISTEMAETLRANCNPTLGVEIYANTSIESITTQCDLTLVASGTATLQVATTRCPMIVLYHISPLVWHTLAKLLLRSEFISLVNILANKEIVPEFIPFTSQQTEVTLKAIEILNSKELQEKIKGDIDKAITPLNQPGAAANTTAIIKEMLLLQSDIENADK